MLGGLCGEIRAEIRIFVSRTTFIGLLFRPGDTIGNDFVKLFLSQSGLSHSLFCFICNGRQNVSGNSLLHQQGKCSFFPSLGGQVDTGSLIKIRRNRNIPSYVGRLRYSFSHGYLLLNYDDIRVFFIISTYVPRESEHLGYFLTMYARSGGDYKGSPLSRPPVQELRAVNLRSNTFSVNGGWG